MADAMELENLQVRIPYLVDTVRTWTDTHVRPGLMVFDRDCHPLGQVVHVHEGPVEGGSSERTSCIEVRRGAFGLQEHVFIPFAAIQDVTSGGVFLRERRCRLPLDRWATLPPEIVAEEEQEETALPDLMPSHAEEWEQVRGYYWKRWAAHFGGRGLEWEHFEHRFRFAWELGRAPEYARQSWHVVQSDLRTAWDAFQKADEWDQAVEMIRDAWELRRQSLVEALETCAT
jgi:hypothetical protein